MSQKINTMSALKKRQFVPSAMAGVDLIHAGLARPQRIEPHRVFDIVVSPFGVPEFLERLEGVIVARSKAPIDNLLRDALWLRGAQISGDERRPSISLSDRV